MDQGRARPPVRTRTLGNSNGTCRVSLFHALDPTVYHVVYTPPDRVCLLFPVWWALSVRHKLSKRAKTKMPCKYCGYHEFDITLDVISCTNCGVTWYRANNWEPDPETIPTDKHEIVNIES